tara:strand:- start:2469 stop:2813 length:345 start_codon:yes stop_codon:yes gene_type:complete
MKTIKETSDEQSGEAWPDHITEEEFVNDNSNLRKILPEDHNSELKNFIVEYVGQQVLPEDDTITVEMIVEVMAEEFPEFVWALAEENWIRGYHQALDDINNGKNLLDVNNETSS